ncbi:hypothetical protein HS1genome_0911 [Sulfodiicoccus acidiphilus]|uniref:Uncharacterized protein n=1 Tax=Sulfodiicoccus acidiphilus TaxID=1670455 RepID=A0A348B2X0_9CREN|nr:hypothetical protein [Sulfodiicoccus acidiphilus]BBD72522.1 hypothetical protein HS1genome_0911 [Sulfodiicoccus acidiphilus]GGT93939.1 hypothetical protein GCM10007116_09590 [Sulfodiicoccus acidiphilus]
MKTLELILFVVGLLSFPYGMRELWNEFRGRTRMVLLTVSVVLFVAETFFLLV